MAAERSTPGRINEQVEAVLGPPSVTFLVDDDAFREIEAALRKPATPNPALADLFGRPRPE
jgi:uncharacterized protein (DUF1778 family)